MKQTILTTILAVLVTLAIVLQRPTALAESQQQSMMTKWEYAQLTISQMDGKPLYSWDSGEVNLMCGTMDELAQKLPSHPVLGKSPMVSVLNAFGADGWELCDKFHSEKGSIAVDNWVFKRPALAH